MPGARDDPPRQGVSVTHPWEDGGLVLSVTELGVTAPTGVAHMVEIRLSGSLARWLDEASAALSPVSPVSARWRQLGDGRYAIALHLGSIDVDAVVHRDGGDYAGRAVARVNQPRPDRPAPQY